MGPNLFWLGLPKASCYGGTPASSSPHPCAIYMRTLTLVTVVLPLLGLQTVLTSPVCPSQNPLLPAALETLASPSIAADALSLGALICTCGLQCCLTLRLPISISALHGIRAVFFIPLLDMPLRNVSTSCWVEMTHHWVSQPNICDVQPVQELEISSDLSLLYPLA